MNRQNIKSLAPCEGRQPTTDGFPHKKPVMKNDLHCEFIISLNHVITHFLVIGGIPHKGPLMKKRFLFYDFVAINMVHLSYYASLL